MNRLNKFVSILLISIIFLTACDSAYDKLVTQPLNDLVSTAFPEDSKGDEKNEPSDSLLPVTRSSSPGRTGIAFGQEGYPDTNTAMQGIASTGVSFTRLEFRIEYIQNSTGHHEFGDNGYNEEVVAARKNNLHIIGLLTYGPNPAFYEVGDDTAFFELWRKYVQAVVDQFGDSIDHWEIGNEQNRLFFWNMVRKQDKSVRVDIYAEMLNIAYKIIKKHNINDVVIVGGLIADTDFAGGYPPSAFMKALAQTSAAESYDAVAIHPYWGDYLPESPKDMRTADNLKRVNLANYMDDFIKDVQFYAKRDVKIYVTEMGVEYGSLNKLNERMGISDEWLEVSIMARSFATLLSFPEVQAVIWFVFAPVKGGESFAMSDYAKEHMKRISQTLDQAEPLGFYTIKDESGDYVKGAWEFRYRLPNGKIVSWFWDQAETYEEGPAYLEGAKNGSVGHFFVDEKIEGIGAPVDKENPFPFGSLPGILIGDISDEMEITVLNSQQKEQSFETFLVDGLWGMAVKILEIPYGTDDWKVQKFENPDFSDRLESKKNPGCMIIEGGMAEGGNERYFETDSKLIAGIHFRLANEYHILGKQNGQYIEWENYELRIIAGDNPEACLQDAWYILQLAAENNFGIEGWVNINTTAEINTVECGPDLHLSFNPDVWQTIEGKPGRCLELKDEPTCIVHYQWGHGMDPDMVDMVSFDQKIGNTNFTIARYWIRSNSKNILYGYHWDVHYVSAENYDFVELSDNCLDQFDELMRLSEAKGFKP